MDNKDPITLAGLFEGDIDGVTAQDIQECIIMRLLNKKLLTIQFLHTIIPLLYGNSFLHNGVLDYGFLQMIFCSNIVLCLRMPRMDQEMLLYLKT